LDFIEALMKLYRDFTSQEEIDHEYNLTLRVPDYHHWLEWYEHQSAQARDELDCVLDVRFGPTLDETIDLFPAKEPGSALLVFIHGGYWFRCSTARITVLWPGGPLIAASLLL
jgi:arylformamidase